MTHTTRSKILELAQHAIATRGYSAFSFRELAAELGIKSASIHYHFPTKTHLGVEVARAYREKLQGALEQIALNEPESSLQKMVAIYRQEAINSERMTVCTMLAAEIHTLPDAIKTEMKAFYELNLGWIKAQLIAAGSSEDEAHVKSRQVFALLQGALMGAKGQADIGYFDVVTAALVHLI